MSSTGKIIAVVVLLIAAIAAYFLLVAKAGSGETTEPGIPGGLRSRSDQNKPDYADNQYIANTGGLKRFADK